MTTPVAALILCAIHASLVVAATLTVRACIARRLAASRAAVGAVGMSCVLVVTLLTFLPLPRVWIGAETTTVYASAAIRDTSKQAGTAKGAHTRGAQPNSVWDGMRGIPITLGWLRSAGDGVQRATDVADTAPRGWKHLIVVLAVCGMALAAIRLCVALSVIRRLYRASTVIRNQDAARMLLELERKCRYGRPIELRETAELASAATFGWLRPVILLPAAWPQWSRDELAAALAHEMAHIRRGDYLLRLVAQLGAAVHFYHPVIRLCVRCLAADQEFAADRLARCLGDNEQAYTRGLARLALRYHDSLQNERGWSSVSVMPNSSDFLARRLQMLRTKDGSTSKPVARLVSCGASVSVIIVSLVVTLLRGPIASAEKAVVSSENTPTTSAGAGEKPLDNQPKENLFARKPFDVSLIPSAANGAFLIRLGDLLRNPKVEPHVTEFNRAWTKHARAWTKSEDCVVDLREIEWIAGNLTAWVRSPKDDRQLQFGTATSIFRMAHAADWQQIILKRVPGSTLATVEGESSVQLPVIPYFGPIGARLRFPDDKTIVVDGTMRKDAELSADLDKVSFEKKPARQPYAWGDAWRAVDGGLVTLVVDNSKTGWSTLPDDKKALPEFTAPLAEKVKYYAIGCDWTENSKHAGFQIRATCADQDAVKELHLAASILLNRWPDLIVNSDQYDKYHKRVLHFFSSVNVQRSPARGARHFLHANARLMVEEDEVTKMLRNCFE